ncbi:Na(+)/H(+) exchange regulatory cofactor NHE-RF3 [Spea bombifrons]|uniref:Na(+)/H(+) exchange regulatory cofactor NHE-RF3 n=1 Tax=Spea bombifrons TaxID=233779 RepID=UPI002348F7AF|nr:Na(+)/H(+) exchange regulatory cofactor NHE-RF3 [Spea bombifrons]
MLKAMASPSQPRECTVTKQDGKGYGFFLRIERDQAGHLVRSIEKGSSADKAGLKDGDRVLRVNGMFVDEKEHKEVVELIKGSGNSVSLLIWDGESYESAKRKGEDLSKLGQAPSQPAKQPEVNQPTSQAATNGESTLKPRICYLNKDGVSFGFALKTTKENDLILTALVPNGIAAKAGIREGDRIIELNGKNVEEDTHDQIASKVKESGASVVFLVSDKETMDYFSKRKMKITGEAATLELLPHKPRIVELKKEPSGYGFYLRQEKNQKGHFVVDIDAGSPAEKAKLKDYDRVVAVNGQSVESFDHEQVVEAIRKGGEKTTLLIVDKKTDDLYTMAGVSPYLYLQELKEEKKSEVQNATAPVVSPTPTPSISPVPSATAAKPTPSPDPKHKPRLCRLQKGTGGYGFHLNAIKEVPGQFIKQVAKGGPAEVAGVKEDDVLLEVNGENVEKESYVDVVTKIKSGGSKLTILVISQEGYEYYKAQKIPIAASMADPLPEKESPPSYGEVVKSSPEKKEEKAETPTAKDKDKPQSKTEDKDHSDSDSDSDNKSDDDTQL